VLRFAEVLRRDAGPVRRAEIAAACGYADRSHLNRDRRRRGQTYDPGATPAQGPVKEPRRPPGGCKPSSDGVLGNADTSSIGMAESTV
jgi:hypothetical protein